MEYIGYKLHFPVGLHIGNGSLEDSEKTFDAMHLFSALCIEAVKKSQDDLEKLLEITKNGEILFSDAFPFIGDRLYLPKPMTQIVIDRQGDSKAKKAFKKLEYVPAECLDDYSAGKLDAEKESMYLRNGFCNTEVRTVASISQEEETKPYRIGVCTYRKGAGLYLIIGYDNLEVLSFLKTLLENVGYSGIGGKRSSGLGRFAMEEYVLPEVIVKCLKNPMPGQSMSLSVCLPDDDEMESVMEGARYRLIRRGGFVSSTDYADTLLRKKDLFVFQAGSCFEKRFSGSIIDVSIGGKHPVYRYAKPLFMEVSP